VTQEKKKFKRGTCIYDGSSLVKERLWVKRYTAHGLIEVKDYLGFISWVNPEKARLYSSI
jgi:hypothetical protein